MNTQFVAYYRVSTQRQGRSGLGLDAQRESVAQYVAGTGGTLVEEHVEVESGRHNDRPVLAKALAACRRSGATLVIAKLDRLARSVHFISGLMEAKVAFVAVDIPSANPLMLHMLAAFAEHERLAISERTKAALAAAKARGVRLGTYGATLAAANRFAAGEFAETLAPVVQEIKLAGASTLREIGDGLEARGIATREGVRCWAPTTVARLIARLGATNDRQSRSMGPIPLCKPENAAMAA